MVRPKTPLPTPVSSLIQESESSYQNGGNRSAAVWRTIALFEAAILMTSVAWLFTNGVDNIKHSEIQYIMDTRAPWIHDKSRIEDKLVDLKKKDEDTNSRIDQLQKEFKEGDAGIINRIQGLELKYYREHPQVQPP